MTKGKGKRTDVPLEQRPLTTSQASRLAALTGLKREALDGLSAIELADKFRWQIDPELFRYRRVCGRVVKKDPVTGEEHPVPFATVHVEDTDCRLLTYAPAGWDWIWFFPFNCQREVIATVVTDACGEFCVYVPRWEVDWILKWRRERICLPDVFVKPSIRDLLDELIPEWPPVKWPPRPEPDPIPWLVRDPGFSLRRAEELAGREVAEKLARVQLAADFGASTTAMQKLLDAPAFTRPIAPPLPDYLADRPKGQAAKALASAPIEGMKAIQDQPHFKELRNLDFRHYIGPFRRCHDVFIPEWSFLLDVPDITFRVTQDVDGDGDEEVIYSEGYFDVRWNSGSIPDVTLEASEIAQASVSCEAPEVPCAEPQIVLAGLMPLHNPDPAPYHDAATGYARRPNRPHASGSYGGPATDWAQTPFAGTVQLYGCNQHQGAKHYRLRYALNGGPLQTFAGHSWKLFRWVGSPGHLEVLQVTPDANGWYEILPNSAGWMPAKLLLNWPTTAYQNGLYQIQMELGNASKSVIHSTSPIGIRVDNSAPNAQMVSLAWREVGTPTWTDIGFFCPVVRRPAGKAIEFKLVVQVSANHLRTIEFSGGGCGGDKPVLVSSLPAGWETIVSAGQTVGMRHWHTSPGDNSFSNTSSPAVFQLAGSAPSGVYSFSLVAHGRAFNPAGGDGGVEADWFYNPVEKWVHPSIHIAVVDD